MTDYQQILDSPCIMHPEEKILLGLCAAMLPPESPIVEVGTFTGGSARLLKAASRGTCPLHSLDIADHVNERVIGKEDFHHFLGRADEFVQSFHMPVGLAFIDGDHSFKGVLSDFENLRPLLPERAVVAFHDVDYDHVGVKVFCDTLVRKGCLRDVVQASRLLVGMHDPSVPTPGVEDFAETVRQQALHYDDRESMDRFRRDAPQHCGPVFTPPADLTRVRFIGRGSFGKLISRFFDIPWDKFIDSSQADDLRDTYIVCSYAHEAIERVLVHSKGLPPSQAVYLDPFRLSCTLYEDLAARGGARTAKLATTETEKALLREVFGKADQSMLLHMHASGYLHQFFTRFFFEG